MTMTRVRFIRGTALGGIGNDAAPGDERDLSAAQAASLVALGRAEIVPAATEAAAPVMDEPAPKPTRRKGK